MILTIRSFAELDGEKLMQVYAESNRENVDYFFPGAADRAQALRQVEAGFLDYLKKDFFSAAGSEYRVLEEGGAWLCAVRLSRVREGLFYLEALETHPAHRREGCAKRLLLALIGELEARGPFRLCDCVGAGNVPSLRAHESCGFRAVREPGWDYLRDAPDEGTVGMELRRPEQA